ncbi:MAG: spore coat U domain-containing protein [Hyphomonadaceae bacterium]|jgi:spore coat protein U-like protein|nr:spore coat U domain-containing protein [Hyphomonadaceae bacterium]
MAEGRRARAACRRLAGLIIGLAAIGGSAAWAATATNTFQARIVILSTCIISVTNTLDFGTATLLTANVDQTTTFDVLCTNTTTFNVGLNAGTTVGGTIATRKMISPASATVDYQMFSNPARTVNWGNTVGTDTVPGTGTGSAITFTIYGRVPPQPTPAPNTYTDTVTITVTF